MTIAVAGPPAPTPPAVPDDDAVPGASSLLAPEGVAAVAQFLERSRWTLVEARPEQVRAVPGRSWTARFQVVARDAAGRPRRLSLSVETSRRPRDLPPPPAGLAARVGLAEPVATVGPFRIWTFPYDPELPDLPDAMCGAKVRAAVSRTELIDGHPVAVGVDLVRYRPGRRAVVRYTVLRDGQRAQKLYGKILRPHRADRLDAALAALSRPPRRWRRDLRLAVPVRLFGGSFASCAARGVPLRSRLLDGGPLPHPARVAAVPVTLSRWDRGADLPSFDERRHPAGLADHAARLLTHVAPSTEPAVRTVTEAVYAGLEAGWAPTALTHGDLYDDQLFVDADFSLGLVDFDDLGAGDPAMDAANSCAHLLTLAMLFPAARPRLVAYRDLLRRAFLTRLDVSSAEFAWREALALLLLATGPFRVLSPNWPIETSRLADLAARRLSNTG